MENNKQNENSQNQGPGTPSAPRERRPNPHRQNNAGQNRPQNQGENNNRPNPNRKANPNKKPAPSVEVNGNVQERPAPNGNKKPNPNQNRNNNSQNRNAGNQNRKPNPQNKPGNKPNQNRTGGGNKNRGRRKNVTTVNDTMRASIEANTRVVDANMNPWKKIDMSAKGKIRFTPLGGLGEIGGNMAVLETETTAIIIDVGMSFPDETMHGVDILVPDFSYLHTLKKEKDVYVIITHGHEDHIGAMPYLFKELQFPIYATPLALAMIENKFNEHGLSQYTKNFNFVTLRKQYQIGDMKIEWMHNTHSIIDACSLAIETPSRNHYSHCRL